MSINAFTFYELCEEGAGGGGDSSSKAVAKKNFLPKKRPISKLAFLSTTQGNIPSSPSKINHGKQEKSFPISLAHTVSWDRDIFRKFHVSA